MSRKKVDLKLENVTIEAVAAEGKALTHVDGMVVFVDFAVPGDVVDIQVFRKKKNYMEGFISRMIQPSPHRVEAFCEHFGVCGGCRWQPLPYEMQLEAKRQQVYDQLVRIGHLEVPEIRPTLPSQRTQFYRNKLEFSASSKRWVLHGEDPEAIPADDRMGLGFHVGKFFDKVLDIKKCWLQPEPSNAIRLFIKQFCIKNGYDFYDIRNNEGYFRNMFIRTTEAGAVMLILCFAYEDSVKRIALLDALVAEFPQITSLWYVINEKLNERVSGSKSARNPSTRRIPCRRTACTASRAISQPSLATRWSMTCTPARAPLPSLFRARPRRSSASNTSPRLSRMRKSMRKRTVSRTAGSLPAT